MLLCMDEIGLVEDVYESCHDRLIHGMYHHLESKEHKGNI